MIAMYLKAQLVLARCPHCGIAKPLLGRVTNPVPAKSANGDQTGVWVGYQCVSCGDLVIAKADGDGSRARVILPETKVVADAIPERPSKYLQQAIDTVHAPSAAIVMAASAVDAMLKEKGLKDGKLYTRIKKAVETHVITPEMETWAHDVRLDANDERHADEAAKFPTEEDARRCIEFAEALGEYMFVLPARVKRGIQATATQTPQGPAPIKP
jgi:hypothetical protein